MPFTPAHLLNRSLGKSEHMYWLLDKAYCLNFIAYAELEGSLSVDDLNKALRILQHENPILRAEITLNWRQHPVFRAVNPEEHPILVQQFELEQWQQQSKQQLATPFPHQSSPLVRCLWFKGKDKQSTLALVFHHSIADGRSGANLLAELLNKANSNPETVNLQRLTFKTAQPSAQRLDLFSNKTLRGKASKWKVWLEESKQHFTVNGNLKDFDRRLHNERDINIRSLSLDKNQSASLLAACREHNTTIHGALGAAFLLAVNSEHNGSKLRKASLSSLADLRGLMMGNLTERDLGLYVATLTTAHTVQRNMNFWALAKEIPSELKQILHSGGGNMVNNVMQSGLIFTPNTKGARRLQAFCSLQGASPMLTNIGRIPTIRLGDNLSVKSLAFAVSPAAHQPFSVTVTSYEGEMKLNVLYDRNKLDDNTADRMIKNALALLEQHSC